jgi:hypothetical protein
MKRPTAEQLARGRAQVTMEYGDRLLLGDIVAATPGDRLVIHHFNGERWPVAPYASEVTVLNRR